MPEGGEGIPWLAAYREVMLEVGDEWLFAEADIFLEFTDEYAVKTCIFGMRGYRVARERSGLWMEIKGQKRIFWSTKSSEFHDFYRLWKERGSE